MAARPDTRNRAEIPAEFRWDFSAVYPSWEAWEQGLTAMEAKMDRFAAMKGTLAQGPAAVLAAYRTFDEIGKLAHGPTTTDLRIRGSGVVNSAHLRGVGGGLPSNRQRDRGSYYAAGAQEFQTACRWAAGLAGLWKARLTHGWAGISTPSVWPGSPAAQQPSKGQRLQAESADG